MLRFASVFGTGTMQMTARDGAGGPSAEEPRPCPVPGGGFGGGPAPLLEGSGGTGAPLPGAALQACRRAGSGVPGVPAVPPVPQRGGGVLASRGEAGGWETRPNRFCRLPALPRASVSALLTFLWRKISLRARRAVCHRAEPSVRRDGSRHQGGARGGTALRREPRGCCRCCSRSAARCRCAARCWCAARPWHGAGAAVQPGGCSPLAAALGAQLPAAVLLPRWIKFQAERCIFSPRRCWGRAGP